MSVSLCHEVGVALLVRGHRVRHVLRDGGLSRLAGSEVYTV